MRRDTSKTLRAGDLSHTVTINVPEGAAAVPGDLATGVPAAITPVPVNFQNRESLAAGGLQMSTAYTVSLRYREDLSPAYVLVEECCTQRRFQILNIVPSDRRDALDMTCVTAN